MEYFSVQRADCCVWLKDIRPPEDEGAEIHMTASQAHEVGLLLIGVASSKEFGGTIDEKAHIIRDEK